MAGELSIFDNKINSVVDNIHDTDLPAVKAETVLIVADTNELQTDWANEGRLDTIVDGIKTKTDTIPTSPAAVGSAMTLNTAEHNRLLATKTSTSPLTTGTLFTYAGTVGVLSITGRVSTIIQSQATTVKLSITPDALAAYDICATKDINAFAAGTLLSITGTAADAMIGTTAVGSIAPGQASMIVATCVTAGTITVTYGAASAGAIVWEVLWVPLNAAGSVAAA